MELTNEFTVPVPVERAWEVLNDVELIAPCLPGAQLQEVEGDEYRGIVKVKVGPITAEYKGAATFREQDLANRKIILEASGRDTRGQGSASAVITATMTESGSGADVSTHVVVDSDVTIKGKVAQFGRGMIAEVSNKLLTQFVECLEGKLDDGGSSSTAAPAEAEASAPETTPTPPPEAEPAPAATPAAEPVASAPATSAPPPAPTEAAGTGNAAGVRKITHEANEPVDLLDAAGAPLAKRLAPAIIGFLLLLVVGRWRSHRRNS